MPSQDKDTPARRAAEVIREINYPHGIHPALVPGVSIEDQKVRYGIDKLIVIVVGLTIIAFVAWGISDPAGVLETSTFALNWSIENIGWLFNIIAIGMVLFLLALAFSRYGRIPLGLDGETPEYSTASWTAMLFSAGIGIGIIFFGPYEPLSHYLSPLPGLYEPATQEAVKGALAQSALHWGINAWAIYAIVGLAVAYASYRKGRVPLMSSILTPLFGNEPKSLPSRLIDGMAIIATLFGTAASLGIGALQISRGVEIVSGIGRTGNQVALAIIVVLTVGTIASAVSGVARGIRWLSNINMMLAFFLAVFFFIAGPTTFLANVVPGVVMEYAGSMPEMLSASAADGEATTAFVSGWTTFYWAWWVSWAPFVGVFIAKISRGRTIRQFVIGVLTIPSTIVILAFTILGGTTIWMQRDATPLAPGDDPAAMPAAEDVFFMVLDQLPGSGLIAPVVIVMLAIFFITTADSASLVNSQLSQGGNPNPNKLVTAFWAICMAGIAVVILLMGGQNALQGLQNLITVTALPFSVILILMAVALFIEIRRDPMAIRAKYEQAALTQAVRRGLKEHGDHFELVFEEVPDDEGHGFTDVFDSTASEYTEWYQRTDEDGNPVAYDYDTGTYTDEIPAVQDPDEPIGNS